MNALIEKAFPIWFAALRRAKVAAFAHGERVEKQERQKVLEMVWGDGACPARVSQSHCCVDEAVRKGC